MIINVSNIKYVKKNKDWSSIEQNFYHFLIIGFKNDKNNKNDKIFKNDKNDKNDYIFNFDSERDRNNMFLKIVKSMKE